MSAALIKGCWQSRTLNRIDTYYLYPIEPHTLAVMVERGGEREVEGTAVCYVYSDQREGGYRRESPGRGLSGRNASTRISRSISSVSAQGKEREKREPSVRRPQKKRALIELKIIYSVLRKGEGQYRASINRWTSLWGPGNKWKESAASATSLYIYEIRFSSLLLPRCVV